MRYNNGENKEGSLLERVYFSLSAQINQSTEVFLQEYIIPHAIGQSDNFTVMMPPLVDHSNGMHCFIRQVMC